jgi:hypothetical protein
MSGIRLEEMEASNMLDTLHYLFEEDTTYTSSEQYESRENVRKLVYRTFYDKTYKYASDSSQSSDFSPNDYGFDTLDAPVNATPAVTKEVKPYFPPTQFNPEAANPFGNALREAPLG